MVNKNTAYEKRLNKHMIRLEGSAKILVTQVDDLEGFKVLENEYDNLVALSFCYLWSIATWDLSVDSKPTSQHQPGFC